MNIFSYLFIRIGTALLLVIWISLFTTLASAMRIKSRNLTDEFKEFKKNNKGPLVHIRFIFGKNFIFIWSFIVVAMLVVSFIAYDNQKYYDMRGNEYNNFYKVVYYTEDGAEYVIDRYDYYFTDVDNPDNKIDDWDCFLDRNGYLVFKDHQTINYDESAPSDDPYCFYDNDNNYYARPDTVYWNENGEIIEYGSESTVKNDILEKLKPYIDKLIEKQDNQG